MKTRFLWFVGLGLLAGVLSVFAATQVISRGVTAPTSLKTAASVGLTTSSGVSASTDAAALEKIVAKQQAIQSLREEIRAAKAAGHQPSADVYRRLQELRPISQNRGGGHLDQGGEDCASATVITSVTYIDAGTTAGYQNNYDPDCSEFIGYPAGGNSPDVVYTYTPSITSTYHVSLCGSTYDTRLFVYAGSCSGSPIDCNDDGPDCWPGSDIPSVTLTADVAYYFVVDGYGDDASGDYVFTLEELAPPPTGDVCGDPIAITSFPYSVDNATTCDFMFDYSPTCLVFDGGPDVIYSFTLTQETSVEVILNAHIGSSTLVMPGVLLSDHCPPDGNCIASAYQVSVDGITPMYLSCSALAAGTYYIMVGSGTWGQTCFSYDLTVQQCGPCDITSQGGDIEEAAEPFPVPGTYSINDPNGGCNNTTPQYEALVSGQTFHGRTFSYTDSITGSLISDTDWYRFVLTTPHTLNVTFQSESWLRVGLLQGPCQAIALQTVVSTPCGNESLLSGCLDPGEYYVKISRGGTLANDGLTYDYRASFVLTPCTLPSGRCCYAGTCTMNTHPECVALDGYWDGSLTCDVPCPNYPPNDRCYNAGVPATLPATFNGNNANATNDCPQFEGDPQVWHVFTTTETSDLRIDYCGTVNFSSFNQWLYTGCPCEHRTEMAAVDWGFCSPITAMTGIWRNIPAGTYYISITMYNPNSIGDYTIHVNAVSSLPPENDDCTAATPLTLVPNGSVSVSGTTMNAVASCTNICNEGGFDYYSTGGDVFYSLNLTECRRIAIALGTSDMHVAVYQGQNLCCTDPAFLCNDDDEHFTNLPSWDVAAQHPGGSRSYVAANFEPGIYLIRVAKYASQVGAYTLTVYDNGSCHCLPPVANDVTVYRVDDNINVRWTTDAASVTRGFYRLYSNTIDMPAGDPSWTLVQDNITPVEGEHHLYYTTPYAGNDRMFYFVTGVCQDPAASSKMER
jgi:hypothetical protein